MCRVGLRGRLEAPSAAEAHARVLLPARHLQLDNLVARRRQQLLGLRQLELQLRLRRHRCGPLLLVVLLVVGGRRSGRECGLGGGGGSGRRDSRRSTAAPTASPSTSPFLGASLDASLGGGSGRPRRPGRRGGAKARSKGAGCALLLGRRGGHGLLELVERLHRRLHLEVRHARCVHARRLEVVEDPIQLVRRLRLDRLEQLERFLVGLGVRIHHICYDLHLVPLPLPFPATEEAVAKCVVAAVVEVCGRSAAGARAGVSRLVIADVELVHQQCHVRNHPTHVHKSLVRRHGVDGWERPVRHRAAAPASGVALLRVVQ